MLVLLEYFITTSKTAYIQLLSEKERLLSILCSGNPTSLCTAAIYYLNAFSNLSHPSIHIYLNAYYVL